MKRLRFLDFIKSLHSDAVIVAAFSPGFSSNLSSWRIVIDKNGNLFQDAHLWEWTEEAGVVTGRREEQSHIGISKVIRLLETARTIINQPPPPPSEVGVEMLTDAASYVIMVRLDEEFQRVPAFREDFDELWDEIHLHAPYSTKA